MSKTIEILCIIVPVFALIALGFFANKTKILSSDQVSGFKTLVINFTVPALLFKTFYAATYSANELFYAIIMFIIFLICIGFGFLLQKIFIPKWDKTKFMLTGYESGLLGYPLFMLVFGTDNLFKFATIDIAHAPFIFCICFTLLKLSYGQKISYKLVFKSMFSSMPFLAIMFGVLFGVLGIGKIISESQFGSVLNSTLNFIAAPTTVLILFSLGYEIVFSKKGIKVALITSSLRLFASVIMCLVALAAVNFIAPDDALFKWSVILLFTLPPSFILPIFFESESDSEYASTTISIYTIFSLMAFVVIAIINI